MRIECRLLGRMNDHLGRRVAIGYVYGPRAIFILEPGVPPKQTATRLLLCAPALVPSSAPVACAYYREKQSDSRQQLRKLGCVSDAGLDELGIAVVERVERVTRLLQGGLSGHCRPWTCFPGKLSCRGAKNDKRSPTMVYLTCERHGCWCDFKPRHVNAPRALGKSGVVELRRHLDKNQTAPKTIRYAAPKEGKRHVHIVKLFIQI